MLVRSLTVGAFQENCWLLADEAAGRGVLVDPGAEGDRLVAWVREAGVELDAVWLTHAHVDHVGGIAAVVRAWDVPVLLHPADRPLYDRAAAIAQMYGLGGAFEVPPVAPTEELADGGRLSVGALAFDVLHVPGHAPGLCVFRGEGLLVAGDLLFAGSVGRTDLPFSDGAAMARSLDRVAALEGDLRVLPGHGPETTLDRERASNPFLAGVARPVRR